MLFYPMRRIAVTAGFGMYSPFGKSQMHYAIDISGRQSTTRDVSAAHSGRVVMSAYDSAGGNMVAVLGSYNDRRDVLTRYAHLESRAVKTGDEVTAGQVIGVQGNTGTATTARHLHFETWLVPKGYSYSFSDRERYAVDPLSVCALKEDQEFISDGSTRYKEAFSYPEPKVELRDISPARIRVRDNLPLFFCPQSGRAEITAGYNRGRDGVLKLFGKEEYPARFLCENDGKSWGYIETPLGWFWIPLEEDKYELKRETVDTEQDKPDEQRREDRYYEALLKIKAALDGAGIGASA